MSTITTERLTKILSETQAVISECNPRGVHGSVEVNARLFENVLMELLLNRAAMLQAGNSPTPFCSRPAQNIVTPAQSSVTPEQSGSHAVIPDGWVACSERMPERGDYLVTDGQDCDVQMFNGEQFIPGFVWEDEITHWMPLPAAPLQEVK